MLTVDCKLYHTKREQEELISTIDKRARSSEVGRRGSPDSHLYKPLGAYNLFSSTKPRASSIVLLKEPIHGKTIEDYFSKPKEVKKFQNTVESFARYYTVDHVYQPGSDDCEVFERSVKPLVKSMVTGKSSTVLVTGPLKSRNNKMLYRLNPEGMLMQIYGCAKELVGMLKKGGKYAKKDFVLKAKGFNIVGELKTDIFALNPLDPSSMKQKSLKLESKQDMIEFCKICRNSISVIRAALQRADIEKEIIQCIQLTFEVKDGETVFQQSTLSVIKANTSEETCTSKNLESFNICLHNSILAKSTKCEVNIDPMTPKEEGDVVMKTFRRVFQDCHKFYILMLLQTADNFENNRATLALYKGIFETKLINKRNKKLGGKIQDTETGDEERDADERLTYSQLKDKYVSSENDIYNNSETQKSPYEHQTETTRPNGSNKYLSEIRTGTGANKEKKVGKGHPVIDMDNSYPTGTTRPGNGYLTYDMVPTSPTVCPGELEKLNEKINSICQSYGLMSAEKEKTEHEVHEAREQIKRLTENNDKLETEVQLMKNEVKRTIEAKLAEIQKLQAEHARTIEDKDHKLHTKMTENESLHREKQRYKEEGESKEHQCIELKKELSNLKQALKTTEEKLHMIELEKTGFETIKQKFEVEIEELTSSKEKLDRNYKRQIQNIQEESEEKLQKAQGKIRILETQVHGLEVKGRSQVEEYEALKKEMAGISNLYKAALDKQTTIQTENNKSHTEILSLKSELEKLKEMLSLKETENREFKHENNQMNILKKELEEHKKNSAARTAEVQKQLNSAYEEAKELRLKQKELKKESEEKENEIRDLNQALELAQARMERDTSIHCAEVEKLAAALRASNEALLKERTLASSLRTELETSTTSNRKLTDKNTSLGTEVSSLKSRLQEVELIVEKRVATSNTTLRMYSQQISTVKKSPPVRDDVRLCLTKTIDGIISIVADYKNSLLAQK